MAEKLSSSSDEFDRLFDKQAKAQQAPEEEKKEDLNMIGK